MNIFELSAVLYYADFLSLLHTSVPVTDSCKYFYIHGVPINQCFIADVWPEYNPLNYYFKKSLEQYTILKNKFGDEGVLSFINNICNLGVAGAVNAIQMLKYIHRYDDKDTTDRAFRRYKRYRAKLKYTHTVLDDDGDPIEQECTKYVAHAEQAIRNNDRPSIHNSIEEDK